MATLQQDRDMYKAIFGEDSLMDEPSTLTEEELDQSVDECQGMLSYAIDLKDQKEIAFWRKMLQEAKVQRRELLTT